MNTKSRGPGPGAYGLPPTVGFTKHDVRYQRHPQYSFGTAYKTFCHPLSPGPGAYNIEKITRHGSDGTPKFTMRPRTDIRERSKGPGPAAHDVHLKPFFKGTRAPAYSLQPKNNYDAVKCKAPSPNTYRVTVNSIRPSAPAYSMGRNLPIKPEIKSPGPASYGRTDLNVKLNKTPTYSMTGRNMFLFKACSPGPNRYNLAEYKPGRKGAVHSFGVRHSDYAPPMIIEGDNLRY